MSRFLDEIEEANRRYAEFRGEKTKLPTPPTGPFSVLTCMDARLDPAEFTDVRDCHAYVVRNAGGRATDDAIRSLVISYKLLDSREWFVVHHTDCDEMRYQWPAEHVAPERSGEMNRSGHDEAIGSKKGKQLKLLTIGEQNAGVVAEVRRIRSHPLVAQEVAIHGHIYNVRTGTLQEVFEATAVGAARLERGELEPVWCQDPPGPPVSAGQATSHW